VEPSGPVECAAEMPLVETVQSAAVSSTTDDASLVTEDASAAGQ